jgi:hypothetical protein
MFPDRSTLIGYFPRRHGPRVGLKNDLDRVGLAPVWSRECPSGGDPEEINALALGQFLMRMGVRRWLAESVNSC